LPHPGAEGEEESVHAGEALCLPKRCLFVPVQLPPFVRVEMANDVQDDAGDEIGDHRHQPHTVGEGREQALKPEVEKT
jgi:hypothetical protein